VGGELHCLIAQTALENDLFLLHEDHEDNDFDLMAKVMPLKLFH
jgi:predicted nucleic acid-binding protein